MADLSIQDEIKFRRKALASQTTIQTMNEVDTKFINPEEDEEDSLSPPPPPPLPNSKTSERGKRQNQIFDLRPEDMKTEKDRHNRPSILAIGDGINQPMISGVSTTDLQSARGNLRRVNPRSKELNEMDRQEVHYINSSEKPNDKVIKSSTKVPMLNFTPERAKQSNRSQQGSRKSNSINDKSNNEPKKAQRFKARDNSSEISNNQKDIITDKITDESSRSLKINENQNPSLTKLNVGKPEFSKSQIRLAKQILEWQSKVENSSNEDSKPSTKTENNTTNDDGKSTISRQTSMTENSTHESNEIKSILKSRRKSSPSICFSFPEGNDEISEISKDDLIDINAKRPKYGSYEYISNQLNIREPFTEPELNVLHTLCQEYRDIANLTYAKKIFMIRSLPHPERVYNFVASSRRSKWLEKSDIAKGAMSSKTLDFLFSRTLRRRSRKIEGETLNLKGFTKDRTLTLERFTIIIEDAFRRRDYLFNCAVGRLEEYKRIK